LTTQGRRPLLVACDVYRPAAIKQLQVLGERVEVPVFSMGDKHSPVQIARASIEHADKLGRDIVILDTAGRLHIDEALMGELQAIKDAIKPHEILLVVDAMTGQDAVAVAEQFNAKVGIDGVILTKLDGDTRGGAALSVRAVTGKPIKFVGVGEKLDALEPFYPDRMASRILGMGDVLTLIEKAQQAVDEKKAQEIQQKLLKAEMNLEDFLDQLRQMRKIGTFEQILGMIPGLGGLTRQLQDARIDEKELKRVEAIIQSMTPQERRHPEVLNGSRRRRIALGSGTTVADVNRLIKQFEETKKMLKQFTGQMKGGLKGLPRGLPGLPFGGPRR
jgi:signal recognition particle subunit SRP54